MSKLLLSLIMFQVVFGFIYSDWILFFTEVSPEICKVSLPEFPDLLITEELPIMAVEAIVVEEAEDFGAGAGGGKWGARPIAEVKRNLTIFDYVFEPLIEEEGVITGTLETIKRFIGVVKDFIVTVFSLITYPFRVAIYLATLFFALFFPAECTISFPYLVGVIETSLLVVTFYILYPTIADLVTKVINAVSSIIQAIGSLLPFT